MSDLANLAEQAVQAARQGGAEQHQVSPAVRNLFLVLHGAYGNQFTAKFSTGQTDEAGKDKGIRSAMLVWQAALARFPGEVIEEGVRRCIAESPKFPPNLPEVEAFCAAAMPRTTYQAQEPRAALPPPNVRTVQFTPTGDRLDWARLIVAKHEAGYRINSHSLGMARDALKKAARSLAQENPDADN